MPCPRAPQVLPRSGAEKKVRLQREFQSDPEPESREIVSIGEGPLAGNGGAGHQDTILLPWGAWDAERPTSPFILRRSAHTF